VWYIIKKLLSCRIQITCLETNLTPYTSMQKLRLKGKKIKSSVVLHWKDQVTRVQNWRLGGNFPGYTFIQNLALKSKKYQKINSDTSLKKLWSCQIQKFRLGAIFIIYTFMQNHRLKAKIPSNQVYIGSNFDNLY